MGLNRFQDFFPDAELVRAMQVELDEIIQIGVGNITTLLRNSQSGLTTTVAASNDDDEPCFNFFRSCIIPYY